MRELNTVTTNLGLFVDDLLAKAFLDVGIARHIVDEHGKSGGDGVVACKSNHAATVKSVRSISEQVKVNAPYLCTNLILGQLVLRVTLACFFYERKSVHQQKKQGHIGMDTYPRD